MKITISSGTTATTLFKGQYINGTFDGHYFTAKIMPTPVVTGINGSQIPILEICKGDKWNGKDKVFSHYGAFAESELPMITILELVESIEKRLNLKRMDIDLVNDQSIYNIKNGFPTFLDEAV